MAMSFADLKRRKLDDGNVGKGRFRKKQDDENEDINPFRRAKKAAYDEETDTVPVDEEGSKIEEMTEGEAGHTAEEKMGEGDHDVDEDEPLPAFLEKDELEEDEEGEEGEAFPEDEDAEEEADGPSRKRVRRKKKKAAKAEEKREPSFSFRRYL